MGIKIIYGCHSRKRLDRNVTHFNPKLSILKKILWSRQVPPFGTSALSRLRFDQESSLGVVLARPGTASKVGIPRVPEQWAAQAQPNNPIG